MRHAKIAVLALLPAIAACSGAGSSSIQPGQWEMTTSFSTVEAPGMPPEALQAMRAQLANQRQTQTSCITPEQAANPAGGLMNTGGSGPNGCQFSKSTFAGGAIDVQGTCPGPTGGSMTMSWQGNYTPTTMEGQFTTAVEGGPQAMRMVGTMSGRRVGDCPAGG
ncbi:MAG: DUF3617 domain-containing protein [Allosphingosinicella sp.]